MYGQLRILLPQLNAIAIAIAASRFCFWGYGELLAIYLVDYK